MKKVLPFTLALALLLCLGCCVMKGFQSYPKIDPEQVKRISVWSHTARQQMESEDIDKFIRMYNRSRYTGKGTGEGGTPEFGVDVYFGDGSVLHVNDFQAMGRDFEVMLFDANGERTAWCYINNQTLLEYLIMMVGPTQA